MRKWGLAMAFGILALSVAGCGDPCKENVFDRLGDSIATMGKKDLEKDKVLVQRKADRAAACAQKKGGDMKKSLGF